MLFDFNTELARNAKFQSVGLGKETCAQGIMTGNRRIDRTFKHIDVNFAVQRDLTTFDIQTRPVIGLLA